MTEIWGVLRAGTWRRPIVGLPVNSFSESVLVRQTKHAGEVLGTSWILPTIYVEIVLGVVSWPGFFVFLVNHRMGVIEVDGPLLLHARFERGG